MSFFFSSCFFLYSFISLLETLLFISIVITNLFMTQTTTVYVLIIKFIINRVHNDFIITGLKCIIYVTSVTILQIAKHFCQPLVGQTDTVSGRLRCSSKKKNDLKAPQRESVCYGLLIVSLHFNAEKKYTLQFQRSPKNENVVIFNSTSCCSKTMEAW